MQATVFLVLLCTVAALLMAGEADAQRRRRGRRRSSLRSTGSSSAMWSCKGYDLQTHLDERTELNLSVVKCEKKGKRKLRCLVAHKGFPAAALNTLNIKCKKSAGGTWWAFAKLRDPSPTTTT